MKYLKRYKIFEQQLRIFNAKEEPLSEYVKDGLDKLFFQSVEADDIELIKFFLERGADVNYENAIASESIFCQQNTFEYLLSKGMKLDGLWGYDSYSNVANQLRRAEVQRMFIDNDLENLLVDHKIPWNPELRDEPKYAKVIDRFESAEKFGM